MILVSIIKTAASIHFEYETQFTKFFLTESAAGSSHEVDLFGQTLDGDLWNMPASVPNENATVNSTSSGVDLFANAAFVSAPSDVEAGASFGTQVITSFSNQYHWPHLI